MRRTPSLMLLLAVMGCAGEPDATPVAGENASQAIQAGASTADLSVRPIERQLASPTGPAGVWLTDWPVRFVANVGPTGYGSLTSRASP